MKLKTRLSFSIRKYSSMELEHGKWERVFKHYLAYREARKQSEGKDFT
ncbi:hypothetical protein [Heyndrickxia acidicola]|uniref:Uncharacterized protein n=1 Tax=Heyndrickxia acidicola TaxID=209389 RepID=A0ABU6MM12_9BACI|nr:hypothetical protein [Heyndrickxia acidicola]MED1204090.1 hypothetical protein [Heyndrickxia acidicola]